MGACPKNGDTDLHIVVFRENPTSKRIERIISETFDIQISDQWPKLYYEPHFLVAIMNS